MPAPKWAVGMQQLCPGLYVDKEGSMHFRAKEMCEHLNVPYTRENAEIAEQQLLSVLREQYGKLPTVTTRIED